jgi:hypothetical protein
MWMTVAGVRAGRPSGAPSVLLTNRSRSAVLPILIDDAVAVELAAAYAGGVSAGGIDLVLAVVSALGSRPHHVALAPGKPRDPSAVDLPTRSRPVRRPGRAPLLRLVEIEATMMLTDDRPVALPARQALVLAVRSGVPLDVPSPLRTRLFPVEPGVSSALTRNRTQDAVDAFRTLLDHTRPSDFGHSA